MVIAMRAVSKNNDSPNKKPAVAGFFMQKISLREKLNAGLENNNLRSLTKTLELFKVQNILHVELTRLLISQPSCSTHRAFSESHAARGFMSDLDTLTLCCE